MFMTCVAPHSRMKVAKATNAHENWMSRRRFSRVTRKTGMVK
jgi:hypothetical protein